jgi:hypothetical protein
MRRTHRAGERRPPGAGDGPAQVVGGIVVAAGKMRAGEPEDVLDPRRRCAPRQQVPGEPQIDDAPVRLREAFADAPSFEARLVDLDGLLDGDAGGSVQGARAGAGGQDRLGRGPLSGRLQQGLGLWCQTHSRMHKLHPRCVPPPCAAGGLLIGEAGEPSEMAPVGTGRVAPIGARQLSAGRGRDGWFQPRGAEVNPGLQMAGAGLDHHARVMPVGAHGLHHGGRGLIEVDENVARVPVAGVGLQVDLASLAVAGPQKAGDGRVSQLSGCPQPFAGHRPAGVVVNQTDQVQLVGHRRELPPNRLQGEKESAVVHDRHLAVEPNRRTMDFHRTANSVLTDCLSPGAHLTDLQLWLLEAMLSASASDEMEARQLLRLPESFPFLFTVNVGDLRRHGGFNIHRQGLDMDIVSVRQVKVEEPQKRSAKVKKPTKRESPDQNQSTFFNEPMSEATSTPSPAIIAEPTMARGPAAPSPANRGFDLTFPYVPLTGQERSLADLTQPDERSLGYRLDVEKLQAPYIAIEERLPTTTPPKLRQRIAVARNLAVYGFFCYEFHAVSLFWSVSCIEMALKLKFEELNPGPFEMRRKVDNAEERCSAPLVDLEDRLRMKWKIVDIPYFDYSFKALLMWAFRKCVLPDDIDIPIQEIVNSYNNRFALTIFPARAQRDGLLGENPTAGDVKRCWEGLSERQRKHYQAKASTVLIEELPRLRNMMAHPKHFNLVTPPGSPLLAFHLLTDMVGHMWPESSDQ